MADAYTTTTAQSNIVAGAVDRYVRAALRHRPLLRAYADTRPVQVDKPGSTVSLYKHGLLTPATTPLNEVTDPDAVALPNPTKVDITLNEYGNATIATVKARNLTFSDIDKNQMDLVAYNMRDTLDVLVANTLTGGTNVLRPGSAASTSAVTAADVADADLIHKAVTKLRGGAAEPRLGELYVGLVHPDVAADIRTDTSDSGWLEAHKYAAPGQFWPSVTGVFGGVAFVETARMPSDDDGDSGTEVYRSVILGREALAEAVQIEPHVEIGVVPDKLNRFKPMGWYGMLGWALFRQEAIYRIESASSFT